MSATKILTQSVTQADDDTWTFQCPGVTGSLCGGDGVPFSSTGWPTKKTATERGREHFAEHKGEGAMSTLEDFRAKHGLGVDSNGSAVSLDQLSGV